MKPDKWLTMLAVSLSACSLIAVREAPPDAEWATRPRVSCTHLRVSPAIDLVPVAAGIALAGTGVTGVGADVLEGKKTVRTDAGVGLIVWGSLIAAFWGASAWLGFTETARCDRYRAFVLELPAAASPAAR